MSDGDNGLISDHVKFAPRRFITLLSILLSIARRHGHMPDEMLLSSLSSIPKDTYKKNLCMSHMQYAFKGQHGTTICTLAMKETFKYYLKNGSDVYLCLIVASKSFDRVRHDMLFQFLIERGIPAGVLRTLLDLYERQRLRTV